MLRLILVNFLVGVFLIPSITSDGQEITWLVEEEFRTSSGPMIILENGNSLHTIFQGTSQIITERTPSGSTVSESRSFSEVNARLQLIRQVRPDTFLTLSRNGDLVLLTESLQNSTNIGSLILDPQLCEGRSQRLKEFRWVEDTIIAQVVRSICDENFEVSAYYYQGEVVTDFTPISNNEFKFAYSSSGDRAALSVDTTDYSFRLLVSSPSGELIYEEILSGHPWNYFNLQFDRNRNLYLFAREDNGNHYVSKPIKINLTTGQQDTLIFSAPDYHPFTSINSLLYLNDQLVFMGSITEWEVHSFLYSLDFQGGPGWQFPLDGESPFNSFQDIAETENGVFISGLRNQSDIVPSGNAYIIRLDQLPVSIPEIPPVQLMVHPNPVRDVLQMDNLPVGTTEVVIADMTGRVFKKSIINSQMDLRGLAAGVYVLEERSDGQRYVGRFVKQ